MVDMVSVREVGAAGDGLTDDTVAIQAAIDAADSIYFPAGTYMVSSSLRIPSNRRLYGDGPASVLRKRSQSVARVLVNADGSGNTNIVVEQLTIDGSRNSGRYIALRDAIYLTRCSGCVLDGVHVRNCLNDGIIVEYGSDNVVRNCTATNNAKVGIYVSGSEKIVISDNSCQDNLVGGIGVAATWWASITGNACKGNGSYDILAGRDSRHCTFSGNTCGPGSSYSFGVVPEPLGAQTLHGVTYPGDGALYGLRYSAVTGNALNAKVSLLLTDECVVADNICSRSNSQGILLQGSKRNTVRDNRVYAWGAGFAGIQLASLNISDGVPAIMSPPITSDGNTIIQNDFYGSGKTKRAIIDGGRSNRTSGNRIEGATR